MTRLLLLAVAFVLLGGMLTLAAALEPGHPLTGPREMPEPAAAPPFAREITDSVRRARTYPEQPPVIPHSIDGYQIDLRTNRCLTCHSREYVEVTQATMVSISHYIDRDGQMLAGIAPRRYFCTACHVQQTDVVPPVANTFTGVQAIIGPPLPGGPPR